MRGLVKAGGTLIITSGYSWSEDCTPKELWLSNTGITEDSLSALTRKLADNFDLIETTTMPTCWQESGGEIHGKLLHVSVFRHK